MYFQCTAGFLCSLSLRPNEEKFSEYWTQNVWDKVHEKKQVEQETTSLN